MAGCRAAVTAAYEGGSSPSLRDLARVDHAESTVHALFVSHFASATWLHDFASAALRGEGLWADEARRAEAVEKTLADAILVHSVRGTSWVGKHTPSLPHVDESTPFTPR